MTVLIVYIINLWVDNVDIECLFSTFYKNCKYTLDRNIGLQGWSVMTRNMYILYVCVTFTAYLMCKMFRLMCYVNWFHIVIWNQIIFLPSIKNVCIHAFIMDLWENNLPEHYRSMIYWSTLKYIHLYTQINSTIFNYECLYIYSCLVGGV